MTDAADLAHRFLLLWEDYLRALLSNASEVDTLQQWVKALGAAPALQRHDDAASGEQIQQAGEARPSFGAAAAPGASRERDAAVAELARRVAELEERVAAIERGGGKAAQPRARNRRRRVG